jgi:hypothetical protein
MSQRAYWQHSRTGEVWAVETKDGRAVACVGPLMPEDALPILLPFLELSSAGVADLQTEWPLFVRREECAVCATLILPGAGTADMPRPRQSHLACKPHPPREPRLDGMRLEAN